MHIFKASKMTPSSSSSPLSVTVQIYSFITYFFLFLYHTDFHLWMSSRTIFLMPEHHPVLSEAWCWQILQFLLPWEYFIPLLLLKNIFSGCKILGSSFSTSKLILFCLLNSIASFWEVSCESVFCSFRYSVFLQLFFFGSQKLYYSITRCGFFFNSALSWQDFFNVQQLDYFIQLPSS